MRYLITKKFVNLLENFINSKFNNECNSLSIEEAFVQPIAYIKERLNENDGKPSYDGRFLELILNNCQNQIFDHDSIHKLSEIDKKYNALRDYHRNEFLSNVESEIKKLKQISD